MQAVGRLEPPPPPSLPPSLGMLGGTSGQQIHHQARAHIQLVRPATHIAHVESLLDGLSIAGEGEGSRRINVPRRAA
jgi:hypothetical protein